jgi:glutamyl-tRNA synthetase
MAPAADRRGNIQRGTEISTQEPRRIGAKLIMSDSVVTRFAPSPTGYLHVGGARTALFNWLLARHSGGKFLLRIEDTDLARSTQQAVDQLLDDLKWLGLSWDNVELVYQSRRLEIYNAIIDGLMERGLAYKAYESNEELDAQRKIAERAKRQFRYRRPTLTSEQIAAYEFEGRPHVVRLAMPVREYRFDDAVLGPRQGVGPGEVQDFIIRKSDGMPTYHFAVVVDDAEMGITHILRGQEHLLNTVNHIALQEALGYPRPIYAHLPVILNVDGSKMSKRDRDKRIRHHTNIFLKIGQLGPLSRVVGIPEERLQQWLADDNRQLDPAEHVRIMEYLHLRSTDLPEILVHDFRHNGYMPEVLLNFLALLGWSPGGDRERMTIPELIEHFSIAGIGKSNAKFNRDKLLAFNTEACAAGPMGRLIAAFRDYLSVNSQSSIATAKPTDDQLARVITMNAGIHVLAEIDEKSQFLFENDLEINYRNIAAKKVLITQNGKVVLPVLQKLLEGVEDWSAANLESVIKKYCDEHGVKLGAVAQPLRVAMCGINVSPPIFQTIEFLGKDSTLRRMYHCITTADSIT